MKNDQVFKNQFSEDWKLSFKKCIKAYLLPRTETE